MANPVSILNKVARNAQQLGLTVVSQSATAVTIDNGSNDLTVTYEAAQIQAPMGGVDNTVVPYLGIGTANPGWLMLKSVADAAGDITDVLDSTTAAQVLQMLSGFANDIVLENGDGAYSARLRGTVDLLNMGQ